MARVTRNDFPKRGTVTLLRFAHTFQLFYSLTISDLGLLSCSIALAHGSERALQEGRTTPHLH